MGFLDETESAFVSENSHNVKSPKNLGLRYEYLKPKPLNYWLLETALVSI